jgi:hypothetical protein
LTNAVAVVSHLSVADAGIGNSFAARVPKSIETTATGPIAISLDTPNTEYTSGGTKLVSADHMNIDHKKKTLNVPVVDRKKGGDFKLERGGWMVVYYSRVKDKLKEPVIGER